MRGTPDTEGGRRAAERLSALAGARLAPEASDAARMRDAISGYRPQTASKRSLITVSHAIERAVLSSVAAEPTVVIALFQRMEYFERERVAYERIAATGAVVAVGFCDQQTHPLPDGVAPIPLEPGEGLVDEWAVVALGPEVGAFLVATDQHDFDPSATSLEAGRRFRSRWGFSRVQATVEMARLRLVLGDRLPADMVRTIDRLLGETMSAGADPANSAGSPQEIWATTAALHLVERLSSARTGSAQLRAQLADAHAAATARYAVGTDQQSGLTTPEFLHRWSDAEGTTVLPVGLGLLDLAAVERAREAGGSRAAYHAARRIAAAVTQPLGPVDAAVRLSEHEFLVVLPGASELHLARVCDEVLDQLVLASDGYPHIPLSGRLATTVTRMRPLPVDNLRLAVRDLDERGDPDPRTAGSTRTGDPVVVCLTRPPDGGSDTLASDAAGRNDPVDARAADAPGTNPNGIPAGPVRNGNGVADPSGAPARDHAVPEYSGPEYSAPDTGRNGQGTHTEAPGAHHGNGQDPAAHATGEASAGDTGPAADAVADRSAPADGTTSPSRPSPVPEGRPPGTPIPSGPAVDEVRNLFDRWR